MSDEDERHDRWSEDDDVRPPVGNGQPPSTMSKLPDLVGIDYPVKLPGRRQNSVSNDALNDADSESTSVDSRINPRNIKTSMNPGVYRPKRGHSRTPSRGTMMTEETTDSRKQIFGVDENEERGNWSGRFDFLLSLLGYAVGLGNVWRFPYLCYRNGGGAFLIPFIIMMIIIGVPLFFMEACLGQFCSSGPMTCWKFAPLFKGVGIAMVIVSAGTSMYYNMILAWAYFYMFASFTSTLPWQGCNNYWNSKDCSLKLPLVKCEVGEKFLNGSCFVSGKFKGLWNDTLFTNATGRKRISPAEEYFNNRALGLSDGLEDFGQPRWELVLCLLLAWFVCFLCLIKGIKTTGKVVYFTAIFPYVVLVILFFRGITLEGAGKGVYYYIVPEWGRLLDARVWKDAAVQIFFSMSIAGGGLVTLSSYNRFHNNILKDSVIVSLGDTLTCIFAGFVIFSYLGFMANKLNVEVKDVAKDGAGLAFVVYPEAVTNLPPPPLWSILFFFMLITLGLDSQFAMLETVLTGVLDQFPHLRPKKTLVILCICIVFFFLGLPLTELTFCLPCMSSLLPGGMYLLQLMDNYVGGWTLLIIGLFENICVAYVYGVNRFLKDIETMLGFKMVMWWKICWWVISPVTLVALFIFTFVDYTPSEYGDYKYPGWADALGWIMAFLSVLAIPITMLYKISKEDDEDGCIEKVKLLLTPTREWGPALVKHRKLVTYVEGWVLDPWEELATYVNNAFASDKTKSQSTLWASETALSPYFTARKKDLSDSESYTATEVSKRTGVSLESYV
ncbi:sodium- and chloride-dependent glycine transporter 1-like [Mizuhopecten yessoensis]|uniref:Transporter n=1 Tax=Mizuhopecten yessoensis TaxID=6573 RepID=A0A210Q779_MIZYE|nr:sodium- and chloride-dependent glycine transporter 1-like [Mizuhopecten yessoensis]OWF44590.1 Sodium- and chloride-dependent glycine transporter 2 [Mizuhopecten yessoensis]